MKPRFNSREAIIEVIDRYLADIPRMDKEAEEVEARVAESIRKGELEGVRAQKTIALNIRKRIHWRELKLDKLKARLAEFDTPTLPSVEVDQSVEGV